MSSIPLPALSIKPPESPMDQVGKMMQLKQLAGQIKQQPGEFDLQQQKIAEQKRMLNDQSAATAAMKEFAEAQGKIKMTELPNLILKHGGSADAALKTQSGITDQLTKYQTMKKDELLNLKAKTEIGGASAQSILSLADQYQPAAYSQERDRLLQSGQFTTQELPEQFPGKDWLKLHTSMAISSKDQQEIEIKNKDAAAAMLRAQAADKAAGKPPAEITDIADYTKTYLAAKGLKDTPSNQLLARDAYYKSKQPFGAQKLVIEQQREQRAEDKDAENKKAAIEWKPKVTADEKKKAELAENIAENATAVNATLARRPDLVGAVSGRFTNVEQMIGNNDKDISSIGNRIHNIAMANSGVHGFRSQEGVKETEANILNHFKNGPDAVSGALASNVDSVQTFIDNARPESYQTHSSQGGAGGYYQKRMGAKSSPSGPPREAKPGMKLQQNKRTGEYREVPDGG